MERTNSLTQRFPQHQNRKIITEIEDEIDLNSTPKSLHKSRSHSFSNYFSKDSTVLIDCTLMKTLNPTTVQEFQKKNSQKSRAGVIPFKRKNGTLFFAFGMDMRTSDLTDFGGHVEQNETPLKAALREYSEESLDAFGIITEDDVKNSILIEDRSNIEIFYETKFEMRECINNFEFKMKQNLRDEKLGSEFFEMSGIVWLTFSQLLNILDDQSTKFENIKVFRMYSRILKILKVNRLHLFNI